MRVGFLRFLGKSWRPSGILLHYYYMRLWRISHQKILPLHQRVPQPLSLSGGLQQDSFALNWQARISPQWFLRLFQKESEHARSVYLVATTIWLFLSALKISINTLTETLRLGSFHILCQFQPSSWLYMRDRSNAIFVLVSELTCKQIEVALIEACCVSELVGRHWISWLQGSHSNCPVDPNPNYLLLLFAFLRRLLHPFYQIIARQNF